jgi:hypothetical protein
VYVGGELKASPRGVATTAPASDERCQRGLRLLVGISLSFFREMA